MAGTRIPDFDTFHEGYAGASVRVFVATTTTLAQLFSDPGLTTPVANPQTLLSFADANGRTYGKWAAPVYIGGPYQLFINETNTTGIVQPPLTALAGQDASQATAAATRGSYARTLAAWLDKDVYAGNYGSLNQADGSAVCTATLVAAIGAAAAQNGGYVDLPAGTIPFTAFTLPQGVVLRGKGVGVTVLQSLNAQPCVTIGGDGAGLSGLTVDGVNVISQSIGVYGVNVTSPVLDDVLIKRFETGLRLKGTASVLWKNLSVLNCSVGAHLRGDADSGGSNNGTTIDNVRWVGGRVSLNTTHGLHLEFLDRAVRNLIFASLSFVGNTGDAVFIQGARDVALEDPYFASNIANLTIQDGANAAFVDQNTVQNVTLNRGRANTGALAFYNSCTDVRFREMKFEGVSFNLVIPSSPILLIDCLEDAAVTSTGDATKLIRLSTGDRGQIHGITGDATPITAWAETLPAGAVSHLVTRIVARRRNGINYGIWFMQTGIARPAATMNVSLVTGAYTVGLILLGHTSGASARIVAITTGTGTAVLSIRDITGTFVPGELVTDSSTGSGNMNSSLTFSDAALDSGGVTDLRTAVITGGATYAAAIDTFGGQARVRVTGQASHIVEWTIDVDIVEP